VLCNEDKKSCNCNLLNIVKNIVIRLQLLFIVPFWGKKAGYFKDYNRFKDLKLNKAVFWHNNTILSTA